MDETIASDELRSSILSQVIRPKKEEVVETKTTDSGKSLLEQCLERRADAEDKDAKVSDANRQEAVKLFDKALFEGIISRIG